jgi:pimeloyl-ACP methyl ester carboxylesterase
LSNAPIPLILLPGMDGSGELFDAFAAHLPADIEARIQRYPANQALGYDALMQRVAADLPRDRDFAILGESFSGPLAIMLAAAHVPHCRALILSASFVKNPLPVAAQLRALVDLVPIDLLPKRLIVDYFLGETEDVRLTQKLLAVSAKLAPEVWRARVKAAIAVDVSKALQQIEVPILYLRARHDRLVPPQQAQLAKRLAPQTQIADFDTPHFLLQVAPAPAAQTVAQFVRGALAPP